MRDLFANSLVFSCSFSLAVGLCTVLGITATTGVTFDSLDGGTDLLLLIFAVLAVLILMMWIIVGVLRATS